MRWQLGVMAGACAVVMACGGSKGEQRSSAPGKVTVRTARIDMVDPRFDGATINVVLVAVNDGTSPVRIKGATLEASYEGGETVQGATEAEGNTTVAPGGNAEIPVKLVLAYPTAPDAFLAFTSKPEAVLSMKGTLSTSGGDFTVEGQEAFPTPRLLEAKVKDAQMSSVDDGAAGEVVLELVLSNPNPFPVKAEKWALKIVVDGKELKVTEVAQQETIGAGAGVGYSEGFKIDAESWGKDYKAVLKKASVTYVVEGVVTVGNVSYPAKQEATMKFHR